MCCRRGRSVLEVFVESVSWRLVRCGSIDPDSSRMKVMRAESCCMVAPSMGGLLQSILLHAE